MVISMRPNVHQARQQQWKADQYVPANGKPWHRATLQVGEFMNKNRGSQQRHYCYSSCCPIEERSQEGLGTDDEGPPSYAGREGQIPPIDPRGRPEGAGKPPAEVSSKGI